MAKQQKNQRALEIKNRILERRYDVKLAETLSPITEIVKISDVQDSNTQTPAIKEITVAQSLLDTIAFMKRSKFSLKLEAKDNGELVWNGVFIRPLGENRVSIKGGGYVIYPHLQEFLLTQG